MKILFVCTANIQRSLTAEHRCREWFPEHEYRSAGVSKKECGRNGTTLCSELMLKWADVVMVFESMHEARILEHTGSKHQHKIINLGIPDIYQYDQPELHHILRAKIESSLTNL
ncbi:phosphotyrosine protein phosphatase [Neptuniibacter sp. QD37_11]|uniref:phosphotyrosine protein phosphatase n=1 Tax=Neptuniibacter sp. QD37_11 TaxID=3398209 RepID=UPI0039F52D73